MKAYVIAAETVNDQELSDVYREEVPGTLVPFGGNFARGGQFTALEGEWPHPRFVIIEFPDRVAEEAWCGSDEHKKIIAPRHHGSVGNLVIVNGAVDRPTSESPARVRCVLANLYFNVAKQRRMRKLGERRASIS